MISNWYSLISLQPQVLFLTLVAKATLTCMLFVPKMMYILSITYVILVYVILVYVILVYVILAVCWLVRLLRVQ